MDDRPMLCASVKLWFPLLCCGLAQVVQAQSSSELKLVMDRLDRLEAQNRELLQEVKALQQQLASSQAPPPAGVPADQPVGTLAEQVEIHERRIAEQDQSKVST